MTAADIEREVLHLDAAFSLFVNMNLQAIGKSMESAEGQAIALGLSGRIAGRAETSLELSQDQEAKELYDAFREQGHEHVEKLRRRDSFDRRR